MEFEVAGLGDEAVDYLAAWERQREVHAGVVAGASMGWTVASLIVAGGTPRTAGRLLVG